jgi:hypothetical protein
MNLKNGYLLSTKKQEKTRVSYTNNTRQTIEAYPS